jgi:hypothetical protein
MRRMGLRAAVLALLVGSGGLAPLGYAQDAAARRESQLKAAYLFNFVKFVEWPLAQPGGPLTVCFVGGAAVREAFATGIENKRVGARRLYVRQLAGAAEHTRGCSVLYVESATAGEGFENAHRTAMEAKLPVLTVSDAQGFARNGGMIELFNESNRLRFNVNVDNAQKVGLRISSSLLQLAATVERGG